MELQKVFFYMHIVTYQPFWKFSVDPDGNATTDDVTKINSICDNLPGGKNLFSAADCQGIHLLQALSSIYNILQHCTCVVARW